MTKKPHRSVAEQLRQAIKNSKMSVTAIANEAGIPQPVLHRFAKGERDLTLSTAEKLLRYFDLELRKRRDA